MKKRFGGIVLDSSFRVLVPFTLVYGVYVLMNGEISPGGGFQAGALLAVGVVLARLILGAESTIYNVTGKWAVIFAGIGTFVYAFTGWLTLFCGGNFLDYAALPFPVHDVAHLRATGILMIEVGVTVCVMMTIIDILDVIVERADIDD